MHFDRKTPLAHAAVWLLLYLATGALSGEFNVSTAALAPYVWLPAGVSLAAMLLSRSVSGIPLAIAFALLQAVLSHQGGRDVLSSLVLGLLAGVAPLAAAALVRALRMKLEGLHLLPTVVAAALVSAVLLGCGGSSYFAITHGMPFWAPLWQWSAAIFVGVCITLPLLAVWAQLRARRSAPRNVCREIVGYAAFVAMAAITWALFDSGTALRLDALGVTCPLYLPMFCVVIVAIVGGARGGTLAVLALTLICLGHTVRGEGPFAAQSVPAALMLLQAQMYIGAAAMLVLIVHALRDAEAQARALAERWRTELELSLAGAAQAAYSVDPASGGVQWRGDVHRLTGLAAERLATVEDVIDLVHPDDRELLRARWRAPEAALAAPRHLPFRLSRACGAQEWLELVDLGSPLSDGNGRVAFVAGVWQNPSPSVR
ncbi:MASE1 domain-containing protein [Paraburkholderia acidisoli]|uniref:PAS domain-containing protein n=1 Tax=Paraburkholderia acidisoli TaxID=2571748 RepID=A0A7Z2JG50_9BURK|nr:MASE1 domain-containing protein [Paraburkholderia acidisoli]QGZ62573.1 PAS domain-containing protein [Paraburkholderia acidisoli]